MNPVRMTPGISKRKAPEQHMNELAVLYSFLAGSMMYSESINLQSEYFVFLCRLVDELDWKAEKKAMQTMINNPVDHADKIRIEYTRLFINSFPQVPAPPYASCYCSSDRRVKGLVTQEVEALYEQYGYIPQLRSEPADHIVTELYFLGSLERSGLHREAEEFISSHFRSWFPKFHHKVTESSEHPYYPVLMQLIDFVTKEKETS